MKRILDVGSAKADKIWLDWLNALPAEVHLTDYDDMIGLYGNIKFHQGDVRELPYNDNYFDVILAVSVIEHIGLSDPQVLQPDVPVVETNGDVNAVKELTRVLKPEGKLIMTFPFAELDSIFAHSARVYSMNSIRKFEEVARSVSLDYYEYQGRTVNKLFNEHVNLEKPTIKKKIYEKIIKRLPSQMNKMSAMSEDSIFIPSLPGLVTWRRKSINNPEATHVGHIDGVLCGVWTKLIKPL
ncbi:MAG: class I SAM-dependent methyltransferase [Microscillaceae bacterium]|nr:class I SAM-dependent methyltransferase [Microscillaceae bacterium]